MSEPETPEPESGSASEAGRAEPAPAEPPVPEVQDATIRRAPKLGVFLLVGAVLGAFVTLVLTSLYPADPNVGFGALYAYFLLYGIPAGLVLGGLVGLLFDRRSRRRARTVRVERERGD